MRKQQPAFQAGTKTAPGARLFLFWLVTAAALIQAVITDLPGRTQAPSRRAAGPAANAQAAELKLSLGVTEWGSSPGVLSPAFLHGSAGHTSTAALPVRGALGFGNVAGTFPVPLGEGGCLCTSGDVKGAVGLREMVAVSCV